MFVEFCWVLVDQRIMLRPAALGRFCWASYTFLNKIERRSLFFAVGSSLMVGLAGVQQSTRENRFGRLRQKFQ
jgi:hypothetical protein